jgi:Protein of unknown function (DUF732)
MYFLVNKEVSPLLRIVVLAVAALGLVGACGDPDSDSQASAPATSVAQPPATFPVPQPAATPDATSAYLGTLDEMAPRLRQRYTSGLLVKVGRAACDAIDAGATYRDFRTFAEEVSLPRKDVAVLVGAAVGALCPEHTEWLEDQTEDTGGTPV